MVSGAPSASSPLHTTMAPPSSSCGPSPPPPSPSAAATAAASWARVIQLMTTGAQHHLESLRRGAGAGASVEASSLSRAAALAAAFAFVDVGTVAPRAPGGAHGALSSGDGPAFSSTASPPLPDAAPRLTSSLSASSVSSTASLGAPPVASPPMLSSSAAPTARPAVDILAGPDSVGPRKKRVRIQNVSRPSLSPSGGEPLSPSSPVKEEEPGSRRFASRRRVTLRSRKRPRPSSSPSPASASASALSPRAPSMCSDSLPGYSGAETPTEADELERRGQASPGACAGSVPNSPAVRAAESPRAQGAQHARHAAGGAVADPDSNSVERKANGHSMVRRSRSKSRQAQGDGAARDPGRAQLRGRGRGRARVRGDGQGTARGRGLGQAWPGGGPAHPELLSPLMAPSLPRENVRRHVIMVRTEPVQRVARPLLSRFMGHSLNRGVFNQPVDAAALKIPDYDRIVERPMDFGTIKERLQALRYEQLEPFIADMRLVFYNARIYNPSTNHVHKAATQMSLEFEEELTKLSRKLGRDNKRRAEHACSLCQGQECALCGEKCLKLEPVMLTCSGACNQRIKRGATFHITRDGSRLWCHKCFAGLSSVLPPHLTGDPDVDLDAGAGGSELQFKRDLLKRVHEEDIPEPWVQCDHCTQWFHQTCVMFTAMVSEDDAEDARFECPLCRLGPEGQEVPQPWVHRSQDTCFGGAVGAREEGAGFGPPWPAASSGGDSPFNAHMSTSGESFTGYTTKESCDGSGSDTDASEADGVATEDGAEEHKSPDGAMESSLLARCPTTPEPDVDDGREHLEVPCSAQALPHTAMSRFIEAKIRFRLQQLGHEDAAATTFVRVVSSVDREWHVPSPIREYFRGSGGSGSWGDKVAPEVPSSLAYRSKAIVMFQTIEGTDICLFCMYVQEYDETAPGSNQRQVYISYLDSVEYFRPRAARTSVYHEIIMAYLAWARRRGFVKASLWACPPQRGNNFIFWCHPQHQRTPSKDRLLAWYRAMLDAATANGIVSQVDGRMDDAFVESCAASAGPQLVSNVFSQYFAPLVTGRGSCPPLFEGDYWIEEACRLFTQRQRRRVTINDGASARDLCEALVRTLRLHPSAHAFNQPVDPVALKIPDYLTVVKRPMDLGTVATRLRNHQYATVQDMLDDVHLVLANATTYNPPKHPVHVAACALRQFFERELDSLRDRWRQQPAAGSDGDPQRLARSRRCALRDLVDERLDGGDNNGDSLAVASSLPTPEPCGTGLGACRPGCGTCPPTPPPSRPACRTRSDSVASLVSSSCSVGDGDGDVDVNDVPYDVPYDELTKSDGEMEDDEEKRCDHDDDDDPVDDDGEGEGKACANPLGTGGRERSRDVGGVAAEAGNTSSAFGGQDWAEAATAELEEAVAAPAAARRRGVSKKWRKGGRKGLTPSVLTSSNPILRGNWLLRDVSKSVLRLKDDLLVLSLAPEDARTDEERDRGLQAWQRYIDAVPDSTGIEFSPPATGRTVEPDEAVSSRPLLDGRHTLLEVSMFRRLQFDTLRRAKHASAVILKHLHAPACSLNARCSLCGSNLAGIRWHCAACTSVDFCNDCAQANELKCQGVHDLTPYHITHFE